ncbi:hypothetical protein N7450_000446 [Penicillium hetheringtonii]|uniref:Uncharacterized protein n=1 Tax=Penicillium hetheringtonii TaxID=911720 RepID=A0AAD6E2L7_9EURO|nr:hypothetical protein N7450_000446 [Penicillium hetheringtonii]
MHFWVGWALWEKLTIVLVFMIMVVLAYASCSLTYTRWKMRRYAAAEARQKEEEAELFPMLTKDDIPFGARALERGIQIEGIWISNHNTPIQTPHPPRNAAAESSPQSNLKDVFTSLSKFNIGAIYGP